MDLTNIIPGGAGEEKNSTTAVIKRRICSHEKTAEGRGVGRGRCPGAGGVPKRGLFKGIFRFYGTMQYPENPNLLLIYGQNPQATMVKSYDYWKKEHRSPKSGVHGYTYMVSTEYEKRRGDADRLCHRQRV